MKKQEKKFVLAGLMLLATVLVLPLVGCDTGSGGGSVAQKPATNTPGGGTDGNGGNGEEYTVSFDKGDNSEYTGDLPADITVVSGTKLTAEQLEGLTDTADYIFEGWYDGETKAKDGTYTVTKDVTLEAKWRDRGVTAAVSFSVDENGRVALSSETKDAVIYYTINGSGPDENSSKYGEPIEISSKTIIKAYAQGAELKPSDVVEKTYLVVTFNADGKDTKTETVESGQKPTDPTDPTNGDMVLAGWYTSEDDGTTLAATAYSFDTPVEGDITLYAWWLPKPGTVVSNGLTIDEIKLEKTNEVQVLSKEVYLKDLYQAASNSQIFVDKRMGSIKPFVMGQYEVTQQLYETVMGINPSSFTSDVAAEETQKLRPVESVSWYDAVVFCNELTKKVLDDGDCVYYSDAGLTAVYTTGDGTEGKTPYMDISKSGYRLPTEAEWELATRGGNAGAKAWQYTYAGTNEESTLGDYAWYLKNSGNEAGEEKKTLQVGTKKPNSLNLYDMSGNVWEWCWDRWDDGSIDADTPSGGAASGSNRVNRGGSSFDPANFCTVSSRFGGSPDYSNYDVGFRLVRSAN